MKTAKKTELLKNSLPLIAAGLGDKLGIHVTVSGKQAYTDGECINIPDFQISSREEKDAVLGLVSHEAAHLKFDSFKNISYQSFQNHLHKSLWNVFEDLRIEKAMINELVGTRKWIDQIWINRQAEGHRKPVTKDSNPAAILMDVMLFHCRVNYRGQTHLQPYLEAAEEAFIEVYKWKLLAEIKNHIDTKLGSLASSYEALVLATEVLEIMRDHEPDQADDEPDNGDSDGDDSTDDEAGNGDSDGDDSTDDETGNGDSDGDDSTDDETGNGDSDGDDSTDDETGNGDSDGDDSTDDETGNGDSDGDDSTDDETGNGDSDGDDSTDGVIKAIKAALSAQEDDLKDDMDQFAELLERLALANAAASDVQMSIPQKPIENASHGERLAKQVKATSNMLTAKLTGLVQENMRVRAKTGKRGNRLNTNVLYRGAIGDDRLFKTKSIKKEIDTIVEIQLDNSISMSGVLLQVAKESQLALAMALSKVHGVTVTASAFPTEDHAACFELLSEGETVKKLIPRMASLNAQGAGTPSASALWYSVKKVVQSSKTKKVILFITDGDPNYNQCDELKRLVRRAEDSGIVVVGIAIGAIADNPDRFTQYFNHALFIQDIKDLKSQIFKVAQDILLH